MEPLPYIDHTLVDVTKQDVSVTVNWHQPTHTVRTPPRVELFLLPYLVELSLKHTNNIMTHKMGEMKREHVDTETWSLYSYWHVYGPNPRHSNYLAHTLVNVTKELMKRWKYWKWKAGAKQVVGTSVSSASRFTVSSLCTLLFHQ